MDPRELFDQVRALWPDAILLSSDAQLEEGKAIWSLVQIYDAIEAEVSKDDWLSIGAWSFHQAMAPLARQKIAGRDLTLNPDDVTFESFDKWMRTNLADEAWDKLRDAYQSSSS